MRSIYYYIILFYFVLYYYCIRTLLQLKYIPVLHGHLLVMQSRQLSSYTGGDQLMKKVRYRFVASSSSPFVPQVKMAKCSCFLTLHPCQELDGI